MVVLLFAPEYVSYFSFWFSFGNELRHQIMGGLNFCCITTESKQGPDKLSKPPASTDEPKRRLMSGSLAIAGKKQTVSFPNAFGRKLHIALLVSRSEQVAVGNPFHQE